MKRKLAKCSGLYLLSALSGSAMIVLYDADFEDGMLDGRPNGNPYWSGGPYKSGNNPDAVIQSNSVADQGGNFVARVDATLPDTATNSEWYGAQLYSSVGTNTLDGYALADLTVSFDASVIADMPFDTVLFEIRENGTATHRYRFTPSSIDGTLELHSFTLDQFTHNGTTSFTDGLNKQLYFQVQDNWGVDGSARDVTLLFDNVRITAVPEPSSLALLGLAGLALGRRKR